MQAGAFDLGSTLMCDPAQASLQRLRIVEPASGLRGGVDQLEGQVIAQTVLAGRQNGVDGLARPRLKLCVTGAPMFLGPASVNVLFHSEAA